METDTRRYLQGTLQDGYQFNTSKTAQPTHLGETEASSRSSLPELDHRSEKKSKSPNTQHCASFQLSGHKAFQPPQDACTNLLCSGLRAASAHDTNHRLFSPFVLFPLGHLPLRSLDLPGGRSR